MTLADINVKGLCEEGLRSTAEFGIKESETIRWLPFPVTAEMVVGIIVGAEAYTRAYLESNGLRDRTLAPRWRTRTSGQLKGGEG